MRLEQIPETSRLTSMGGRFTAASSQALNRHGIYLGRRSTKLHVALYRRSHGRIGGHLPGWPGAKIALVDHRGYALFREHAKPRVLPIVILEPRSPVPEP
jgi:hypothetical protein